MAGKAGVGASVGSTWLQPTAMLVNRLAMPSAKSPLTAASPRSLVPTHHGPNKYARKYTTCSRPPGHFRKDRVVNTAAAYGPISPEAAGDDGLVVTRAGAAGRLRRAAHTPMMKAICAATAMPMAQIHHAITSS